MSSERGDDRAKRRRQRKNGAVQQRRGEIEKAQITGGG